MTSPAAGPITDAPTKVPLPATAMSLANPCSAPGPWIQPRADEAVLETPTRTLTPASRAWLSDITTARDLGVGESHARYGGGMRTPEDVRGRDACLVHRDVGEGTLSGDVPHGPRAIAGTQTVIDLEATAVGSQPGLVHGEIEEVEVASGRYQQALGLDHPSVTELDRDSAGRRLDRTRRHIGVHTDSLSAEDLSSAAAFSGSSDGST